MTFNRAIEISKGRFHVGDGLAADRTTERGLRIFRQTFAVKTMATSHHNHGLWRIEHVIATNGAVALGGSFDTAMGILDRDRQAYRTCLKMSASYQPFFRELGLYLAVEEVFAKPLANPTNTTVIAMINALISVIVPKFANFTVILSTLLSTIFAVMGRGLGMTT